MANSLPPMTPMRAIAGGEVVPPSQEPVVQAIPYDSAALEASHRRRADARKAEDAFSVAPTRFWRDGVMQAVPQQKPHTPPEQPLTPHRLVLEGKELERPTQPLVNARGELLEPAMDEGLSQYLDEKAAWLEWQDAFPARRGT